MEKFEDKMRQQFHNREIQPSNKAWSKLEKQLPPSKSKKTRSMGYYVAASIVGIILLSTILLSRESEISNSQIVAEPIDTEKSQSIKSRQMPRIESVSDEITAMPIKEAITVNETATDKKQPQNSEIENVVAAIPTTSLGEADEKFLDKWAENVAATIKDLPQDNEEALIEEVERLLFQAQLEMQLNRNSDYSNIDAASLLEEVEFELNRTFRDKIFDFLGNEYEGLRTAIVSKFN